LCEQEECYCKQRTIHVKKAFEQKLGYSLDDCHIPTIAFVCSGGGYRSMLMDTGAVQALDELGILDGITYMSTLSGSSWAVSCWISSGLSIKDFKEQLIGKVEKGLARVGPKNAKLMSSYLMKKWAYNQPVTLVDWYGALLANVLLADHGDKRHDISLSAQAEKIMTGKYPLPLYALAAYDQHGLQQWLEVTPFECGSAWLGSFIPTWAVGRQFKDGISIDRVPEQTLGFYLGAFGSGFATTAKRIYKEAGDYFNSIFFNNKLCNAIVNQFGSATISSADIYNFTTGIYSSPLANDRLIHLADAGLDFNLAYPPVSDLSHRKIDILIVFDTSRTIAQAHHLCKMEEYAKKHNCKLPVIDYTDIDKRDVTIFKDDNDPTVPVVIYIPRLKDEQKWCEVKDLPEYQSYQQHLNNNTSDSSVDSSFARTTNFSYTSAQAKQMCAIGEYKMKRAEQTIMQAVEWVIKSHTH
jgi:phospholipase A2